MVGRSAPATTAFSMRLVTAPGSVSATACGASTSTVWAWARAAMNFSAAGGMVWSSLATRYQDGIVFQAGVPEGSTSPCAVRGRWVAASSAAVALLNRPLRNTSRYLSALRYRSIPVPPTPCVNGTAFSAVGTGAFGSSLRWLPGNSALMTAALSPWSGARAAM